MTALERKLYRALKAMDGISHRVSGCRDQTCGVCAENKHALDLMRKAIRYYETAQRNKNRHGEK